jgi:protein-disulfide isomerase
MTNTGGRWLSAAAGLGLASAALALGGCSGGLSMPPTVSAMFADTPSQPVETEATKPVVNVTMLMQPGPLPEITLGKDTAPVTIVQYVSLSCDTCGKFQTETLPKIKKAYIEKGKVRLVVREFPSNAAATSAALAARCVPEKDYFQVVEKLLSTQKTWGGDPVNKDELYKTVKFTGLKREKFDECLANQSTSNGLTTIKQTGTSFGVYQTPTFFVNGKRVAGAVSFEEMKTIIEAALTPATPAGQPQAQQPQASPSTKQAAAKAT